MAVGISPKITLSEDDIQGASLRGKTPSQLTIPELRSDLWSKGKMLSDKCYYGLFFPRNAIPFSFFYFVFIYSDKECMV